eukprot:COSAG01_NODE_2235_length_8095_cov_5.886818_2_plen_99_part_00
MSATSPATSGVCATQLNGACAACACLVHVRVCPATVKAAVVVAGAAAPVGASPANEVTNAGVQIDDGAVVADECEHAAIVCECGGRWLEAAAAAYISV